MLARATLNLGWRRRDTTAGEPLKAGFSSLPRIHTPAAPPMSIWRLPIARSVFVINSGAHVTKGACNFYELLGCRLLIQRTMLLHARRTKRDNGGDRVRLHQVDGIKFY
jgi:hypothetical protein